jgi:hypothetical protein
MKMLKLLAGVILGLLIGTIGGFISTGLQLSRTHPGQMIGISPAGLARTPIFWAVLFISVICFAYLFSRIGARKRRASHL